MDYADSWPSAKRVCDRDSVHHTDPYCCRCTNYMWDCYTLKQACSKVDQQCPKERQVKVEGDCCPRCLQENVPSAQSLLNEGLPAANVDEGEVDMVIY